MRRKRRKSVKRVFQIMAGASILCLMAPALFAGEMAPLDIKLPKAKFEGTPKDVKSSNLEPYSNKKRPPFLAPQGVTNVAFGKPVTVSDNEPTVGEIEMITDGDKEAAEGSYVEFGPGVQWVQVDLGAEHELFAIVAWHYHLQGRVYKDVVVRVSNDPDFIHGVTTISNNDHDNSAGLGVGPDKEYVETNEGRLFDAKAAKARYVRLYSNGNTSNDMNNVIEVEVYGRPIK